MLNPEPPDIGQFPPGVEYLEIGGQSCFPEYGMNGAPTLRWVVVLLKRGSGNAILPENIKPDNDVIHSLPGGWKMAFLGFKVGDDNANKSIIDKATELFEAI